MSALVAHPAARVASFNPVSKLVATLVMTVTLLLSIDPVSAGVTLVGEIGRASCRERVCWIV